MNKATVLYARVITLSILVAGLAAPVFSQRDKDEDPTSVIDFLVVKDESGKPVRNAAVIMHPVSKNGKQGKGDVELKTSPDGKASFDGVPYGTLRVQVLAPGFQTFGEDYDVSKATMSVTVKLKRPQSQFSIYNNPADQNQNKDSKAPPPDSAAKP